MVLMDGSYKPWEMANITGGQLYILSGLPNVQQCLWPTPVGDSNIFRECTSSQYYIILHIIFEH